MKLVTDIGELNPDGTYNYADYLLWQFKERVELIRGKLRLMSAPSVRHQRASGLLARVLGNHLEGSKCDVFAAPFDVRLPLPPQRLSSEKADTVVQPDICVVCDRSKLDERGCIGAPDLVIEILSPGNSKREMKEKFELYESAGVREYWVVDQEHLLVYAYLLEEATGKFKSHRPLTEDDVLVSTVVVDFSLALNRLFED
jgi:Uma2 family endonuclease